MNVIISKALVLIAVSIFSFHCLSEGVVDMHHSIVIMEESIDNQEWDQALQALSQAKQQCNENIPCETLASFSEGYLYERWAATDASQTTYSGFAVKAYLRALTLAPDNWQIRHSAIQLLRKQGKRRAAIKLLTSYDLNAPSTAYKAQLLLGDLYVEENQMGSAIDVYKAASARDTSKEAPYRRIMGLYRIVDDGAELLLSLGEEIEGTQGALASECYQQAIVLGIDKNPTLADKALIRWAALRASEGGISLSALIDLPERKGWASSGYQELLALFQAPGESVKALSWWKQDKSARDSMSRVLHSMGAYAQGEGDLPLSATLYQAAFDIAPQTQLYGQSPSEGQGNAKLQSALALIELHHILRQKGTRDTLAQDVMRKLAPIIDMLFHGKGDAYARNDITDILKFHTILGTIYHAEKQWVSPSSWEPEGAIFQLSHALRASDKISQNDPGRYDPIPHIATLLAGAYRAVGDESQQAETSLLAAKGYLDLDDLDKASKALKNSRAKLRGTRDWKAVRDILTTRKHVLAGSYQVVADQLSTSAHQAWLLKDTLGDEPFITRQRFKLLSDLGDKLLHQDRSQEAMTFYAKALSANADQRHLTGFGDVARIKRIQSGLSRSVDFEETIKQARLNMNNELPGSAGLGNYSFRSGREQLMIQINPDTFIAGELVEDPTVNDVIQSGEYRLRLEGGALRVSPNSATEPDLEFIKRVKKVSSNMKDLMDQNRRLEH